MLIAHLVLSTCFRMISFIRVHPNTHVVRLGFFEHDSFNDFLGSWSLNLTGKCVCRAFFSIFLFCFGFFTRKRFILMIAPSQAYDILGDLKLNRLGRISI